MPPSLVSPYTPRVGTQILLTDLHYARLAGLFQSACPVLNMVYTFPPNKWRTRWDKV